MKELQSAYLTLNEIKSGLARMLNAACDAVVEAGVGKRRGGSSAGFLWEVDLGVFLPGGPESEGCHVGGRADGHLGRETHVTRKLRKSSRHIPEC